MKTTQLCPHCHSPSVFRADQSIRYGCGSYSYILLKSGLVRSRTCVEAELSVLRDFHRKIVKASQNDSYELLAMGVLKAIRDASSGQQSWRWE